MMIRKDFFRKRAVKHCYTYGNTCSVVTEIAEKVLPKGKKIKHLPSKIIPYMYE